ncbi:MAG: ATP-grasp domain-containing protein [Pseudomonadota bacterium]
MATVLILEIVSNSEKLISEAKMLGHRVVMLSNGVDARHIVERNRALLDDVLECDLADRAGLSALVGAYHARHGLDAIVPGFEYFTETAAELSAELGLRGLGARARAAVRHKDALRRSLEATGLRSPRWRLVEGPGDLERAGAAVGFPCVIKPTSSAGSVHVSRADDAAALRRAYERMCAEPVIDYGLAPGSRAVVEAFIPGAEYSVEGVAHGSEIRISAITEKFLAGETGFLEVGHLVEAELAPAERQGIEAYVRAVLAAVEFTVGAFHVEVRMAPEGPVVIEINGRLPGDRIVDLVQLAKGVSLPRLMLQSYLGDALDPLPEGRAERFAGVRFFLGAGAGRLSCVRGLAALYRLEGFLEFRLEVPIGAETSGHQDFRAHLGHAVFAGQDRAAVRSSMGMAADVISFA